MPICPQSIVECLRNSGIYPKATSKNTFSNYVPQNAINYSLFDYYHSGNNGLSQWWMVDFQKIIKLGSYSIYTDYDACDWIKKWRASVSVDNDKWTVVDTPPEKHPHGELHKLNKTVNARYFKLETLDNVCQYVMVFRYIYFYYPSANEYITCISKRKINFDITKIILLIYS